MSKTLKIGINRTKLAIALVLLCAAFSFSAMAQDNSNEPLDAEAVSALIGELKEGLPNLIDDEAQVEAIAEKWNAREDLAGKSKAQILKMLFADVKSVAEDKETQDNIWKSWGGEEKSSDETPVVTPQKPVTPSAPVTLQPVIPVTREFIESNIEVQKIGSYVDGPWTVVGAYFAEFHEAAPVCIRAPGSRFTTGPCIKVQELKIPPGSPPEYLCERKEGKGNCMQYKNGWIAKTCKYGYRYFIWRRTASGAEGTVPVGSNLICTSGKTPVPGEPLP